MDEPTCEKKKRGWFLVWPVLVAPGFTSARVEAIASSVPDSTMTQSRLVIISEDSSERAALAERLASRVR